MDIAQFISSVSGVLLGVIATFGLERWYQNRAQRESAKFEVLKVIRDDMDTLERLILSESEKDRNLRYPRIRRIVRASKMLSLRTVTEKAQAVQDSIKGIEDEKTIIQLFDRLNLAVSDEYKKNLPTN